MLEWPRLTSIIRWPCNCDPRMTTPSSIFLWTCGSGFRGMLCLMGAFMSPRPCRRAATISESACLTRVAGNRWCTLELPGQIQMGGTAKGRFRLISLDPIKGYSVIRRKRCTNITINVMLVHQAMGNNNLEAVLQSKLNLTHFDG